MANSTGVRKVLKDFIKANPASTEVDIVAYGGTQGIIEEDVQRILTRMIRRGKIIKTGDDHSMAA